MSKPNKPHKFISGEKVYLRPYETEEDRQAMYDGTFVHESNLFTGSQKPFTRMKIDQYVDKIMSGSDSSRVDFVICRQEDDTPVGEVVLNEIHQRNANLRIWLFSDEWFGQGYGTEAIRLMLDYGFGMLNLHRIELGVYNHNERGLHVYEKVGFRKEGVLREYLYFDHKYYDLVMMSILEHEYRAKYGIQK